jgi:hypothetical protein
MTMRPLFAAALIGFFLLASGSLAAPLPPPAPAPAPPSVPVWTIFSDPNGVFTVDVPQAPAPSTSEQPRASGGKVVVTQYMVDRGNSALLIVVSRFVDMNVDASKALDQAVSGTASEGRTLVSDDTITLSGHSGRSVALTDKDHDVLTDRIFYFDDCLYQVITTLTPAAADDEKTIAARFVESFRFQH